ncbi:MAG: LuxR family transcriptional regulator [Rhizobiaceae bacterium]|nr:LuxR family transcriptional regulator [Rhizobiaceae bacterium]
MELTASVQADAYALMAMVHEDERHEVRIIASNWIYDAIELAGRPLLAGLAASHRAAPPGFRPRPIVTAEAPEPDAGIDGEEAKLLAVLGHREIYVLGIQAGRQRLHLLLSANEPGCILQAGLTRAQMEACYALSAVPQLLGPTVANDPLSDRERECLHWVSEGKTTDEVAVILGVSANTVNSYVTHAIQKLGASNRAMAMATAIRSGMI